MLKKILVILLLLNSTNCFTNSIYFNNRKKLKLCCNMLDFNSIPQNIIQNVRKIKDENHIEELRYSEFLSMADKGNIDKTIVVDNKKIYGIDSENNKYSSNIIPNDSELFKILNKNNVDVEIVNSLNKNGILESIISYLLISLLITSTLSFIIRNNGMAQRMDIQNNIDLENKNSNTTFTDVIGIDKVRLELEEIVEFLSNSDKYTNLGAQIPRGVLLEGAPGTGKTLLARAVAGEANVPFFSVSGSEFIEMFVGTGAARIRSLFETAKKYAPSIIFIDEIDAIGRQRGGNNGMGNDEREQTLNQLLTEMDGFEGNSGVIVMAATNRGDILDNALLRPGRFDRRIKVDVPNVEGRKKILEYYSKNKKINQGIDLNTISRMTPGFSGADLSNLMNEAAILTVRNNSTEITDNEISMALDKITLGPAKKNKLFSDEKKKLIAYHEAGHAIVGALTLNYDIVSKITIEPRGNAGGLTFFIPDEERLESGLYTREYLKSAISVALGGRIAEELIYGNDEITTGASNDLERVSSIAKQMITEFGMSDVLGNVYIDKNEFISADTKNIIDNEVNKLVNSCYLYSKKILSENINLLHLIAKELIEYETISNNRLNYLIENI